MAEERDASALGEDFSKLWVDAARKLTIASNGKTNGIVLYRASVAGSSHVQMIVVTLPASEPATH